jgi:hypothetical protein
MGKKMNEAEKKVIHAASEFVNILNLITKSDLNPCNIESLNQAKRDAEIELRIAVTEFWKFNK